MLPIAIVLAIVLFLLVRSVVIVPHDKRAIKERLGRNIGTLSPGLHILIPLIDRVIFESAGPQEFAHTFGKVHVSIVYKIEDPLLLRQHVADAKAAFRMASEGRLKKHLNDDLNSASAIDLSRIESEFQRDMVDLFKDWGVVVEKAQLRRA